MSASSRGGRVRSCSIDGCASPTVGRRLCGKHYQAAWKAGTLGAHEKLPPRMKDPKICPTEHKHAGSLVCYNLHQCRCDACSAHRMQSETRRRKDKAYGRYDAGLVDAGPVREHMMMLAEFGIGYKRAAALAGIGVTPTRNIIWGRQDPGARYGELQKRVKRETAEALLAVQPVIENLADGALIPARGVHRRVQALVARGWSQSKIAHMVGVLPSNWTGVMQREHVSVRLHRQIADVYERLWDVEPPHAEWRDKIAYARTIKYAQERRWLPPLAWDDIDNDVEPPVVEDVGGVDEMAIDLAMHGEPVRLSPAERREAVSRLHADRWSDSRIAETLHCNERTVLRIRQELELAAFDQNELRDRGAA